MCHIPIFCWIAAIVAERTSEESGKAEMPKTMTQMYSCFLTIQTSIKKGKYTERKKKKEEEIIFKLGKLAFQQLEMGNLIFYERDLRKAGIDVTEASVYSGVCTQIFREEGEGEGRVFTFVHLSIQEFLAALYVLLCFNNRERNMYDQKSSLLSALLRAATLHDLHKTAVDLALKSRNGHLDLFLRFLLGLSLESNQKLLKHLLPKTSSQLESSVQIVQYIKDKIRGKSRSDRWSGENVNLFYCLNELNQHAVVEHIDREEGELSIEMLLPGEWRTKAFGLSMSEEQLGGFDLQKYIKTPEKDQTELLSPDDVLQKLVPVVTTSIKATLIQIKLTEKSCSHLASALSSPSSRLTYLDLYENDFGDSGVELLCSGLRHQHCRLKTLRLGRCNLTEKSCFHLASVLSSRYSRLTWLDLPGNELLGDSGVELLCSGLKHQHCKLETLRLNTCKLTAKSCSHLYSVLSSHSSHLRQLLVQANGLRASDVEQLLTLEKDPNCRLETLEWIDINIDESEVAEMLKRQGII
ncbi:NACHT, LRR and PYD domains-containing protein 3-like [Engraulis encrasicolus]|uniref:NACHT, LRR and PYD domains-containing protein 3-like n=1 Tax=Engraulis encrasicolus TaxID=184585 RepID=UPI002FD4EE04